MNRFKIWKNALTEDVDLRTVAENFELSGSRIIKVVQHACFKNLARQNNLILNQDILAGIRKEFLKEEKVTQNKKR
jgi:ATP-dependent 26S proteasome regulatory subunit